MEKSPKKADKDTAYVPEWSRQVIWYQIFPERFRNGDPTNDPRKEDMQMTFPEFIPERWKVTDWGANWYKEDSYMEEMEGMDFGGKAQLRRYGGDLQGVLDKVDYLADLGITGIYFNPLNDAPSSHKYDPRHWRHIDRNFGPDPAGDVRIMNNEIADDPVTWQWTAADSMFLEVIRQFHARGIKVIMDYSWNHTGYDFWAVNDIRKNGRASKYADWYKIDPETEGNEIKIEGWWGYKYLPLIKEKVIDPDRPPPHEGNIMSDALKQHIFNVSRRWMDPNGDGNPEDGIDGFRLDVASEMTMGWWRDYRKFIKSVNPEAVLIGEIWWFDWSDLTGPEKMVQGDQFDALMNYRWYALSRGLFTQTEPALKPSEFVKWYNDLVKDIPIENQQAMMNIVASHDTPRISTSLFNGGRFDVGSKLSENPSYKAYKPDEKTWKLLKLYLLHQFTFVGSPHIWNGDELGMWGANDPDNRKPVWWEDIEFEDEHLPNEAELPPYQVQADPILFKYYQKLIRLRKHHPVFSLGELNYHLIDDDRQLFGYIRKHDKIEALIVFNLSDSDQEVKMKASQPKYINAFTGAKIQATRGQILTELRPKTGMVLLSDMNYNVGMILGITRCPPE